jgi:hypothetical protein
MTTRSPDEPAGAQRGPAERRNGPRHPVQIPIEVTAGRELLIHATFNLSGRGAFFQHAIPYAVGTRVGLRILLPGEAPIVAEGEVVNVPNKKEFGMGMMFLGLSPEDEARIEQFAARHGRRDEEDPFL